MSPESKAYDQRMLKTIDVVKANFASVPAGRANAGLLDRIMVEYESRFPGYGFASNKGYGSAEHIEALRRLGPSPIHRNSFIGNFI